MVAEHVADVLAQEAFDALPELLHPFHIDLRNAPRAIRRIRPIKIECESNEWHKERRWLLYATDLDKENTVCKFALENIHSWRNEK